MMSMIKVITNANPNIRIPNLDARLAIMKLFRELTGYMPRAQLKFSSVSPIFEDAVDDVVGIGPNPVLARIKRFETASACLRTWPCIRP